jgi:hypothetical protein
MEPNVIEHLWDTKPTTVFGILVVLLVLANIAQWRRNTKLEDMLLDMQREVLPTHQAVLNFMAEVRDDVKEVKDKFITKLLSK